MNLFKRTKVVNGEAVDDGPYWWVRFIHPETRKMVRMSTKEVSKTQARVAAARLYEDLQAACEDARRRRVDGRTEVSLAEALGDYVESLKGAQKASWREIDGVRKKTLGLLPGSAGTFSLDGAMKLHELTPAMCERLVRERRKVGLNGRPNSSQTIAHELKTLRAAAHYAAALGHRVPDMIGRNAGPNPWRIPATQAKTRYLSPDEWRAVYDHLDPDRAITQRRRSGEVGEQRYGGRVRTSRQDNQDLLVALTMAGGRWSEVANMTWERAGAPRFDLIRLWGSKDQEERIVPAPPLVTAMLERRYGRRQSPLVYPDGHVTIPMPKDDRDGGEPIYRDVPLPDGLVPADLAAIEWAHVDTKNFIFVDLPGRRVVLPLPWRASLRRLWNIRSSPLVFPGRDGEVRSKGSTGAIIGAISACGLNRPDIVASQGSATVHSLRHTFASWLLQGGAELSEVQDALGHATLHMTRRYAHLSKGRTAQRLGGILSAVMEQG